MSSKDQTEGRNLSAMPLKSVQTSQALHAAEEVFDPAAWRVPSGLASLAYYVKLVSPKFRAKHNDHLLYLDWVQRTERARTEYERMCAAEQSALDARNVLAEREFKKRLVREMMNRGVLPTISVMCWKSGAKTTFAAHVGSIMSEESRKTSVLLPATASTSTGASGTITGLVGGENLTLVKFERALDWITSTRELSRVLGKNKHGLGVVIEDADTDFEASPFNVSRFKPLMERTYQLTDGCLLLDGGNDDIKDVSIPTTAARAADVIVFVASNTQSHSHGKMEQTMRMLKKDMYEGRELHDTPVLPGELRSTSEKVARALVVINGVKPDDAPYDFDALRGRATHELDENALVEWSGQGFTVPWDSYVRGGHNTQNPVDLDKIDLATYDAYLDATLAILREGARALGISLEGLPEFKPEEYNAPAQPVIPQPNYASTSAA
ncbi:MAG: hypothetical protein KA604_02830 [Candidatus Saccharimonas sp.]|nr:hypothetical protein [Candidatus Saccharimonas sp.]